MRSLGLIRTAVLHPRLSLNSVKHQLKRSKPGVVNKLKAVRLGLKLAKLDAKFGPVALDRMAADVARSQLYISSDPNRPKP